MMWQCSCSRRSKLRECMQRLNSAAMGWVPLLRRLLWLLTLPPWLVGSAMAGDDSSPPFAGRKWSLARGGPVQTFRADEGRARADVSEQTKRSNLTLEFNNNGTFVATGPGAGDKPS